MTTAGHTRARTIRRRPDRRAEPVIPQAERAERPGWRDPRILLGLLLVAGCVLLGARIMATADDTVAVWGAGRDLPAGSVVEREDLRLTRVHFGDSSALGRYLREAEAPADGAVLRRDVAEGELVPRDALGAAGKPLVEVPLEVARGDLPATVRAGAIVDVWVAARPDDDKQGPARLLLDDVRVVTMPSSGDAIAPEATRQVIVGVPEGKDLAAVLGALGDARIVVTQRSATAAQP